MVDCSLRCPLIFTFIDDEVEKCHPEGAVGDQELSNVVDIESPVQNGKALSFKDKTKATTRTMSRLTEQEKGAAREVIVMEHDIRSGGMTETSC